MTNMSKYSVEAFCYCIRDCEFLGLEANTVHKCTIELDVHGTPFFIIQCQCGGPIKCVHEWFVNFFVLA